MFKLRIYLRIVYSVFNSFKVRTALAVFGVLLGAFFSDPCQQSVQIPEGKS